MRTNLEIAEPRSYSPAPVVGGLWLDMSRPVRPELTPRQMEILSLIARGRSNKEIAFALSIRERTVKFHVAALFERLDASSRTEALVVGLRMGLIRLESGE